MCFDQLFASSAIAVIKDKITKIEAEIDELDFDKREVRPEYAEKLRKIDEGVFLSDKEFEKELGL